MNPLTQIRNTQKATRRERDLGLTANASWHDRFRHSAYVYVGGLDYDLTEGDLLAVFAQYGEVVDVNLIKDKETGKSRGFAFLAYENQKSTVLAVDNLSGARVAGRIIRVEHVEDYKRKREDGGSDDEADGAKQPRVRKDAHPRRPSPRSASPRNARLSPKREAPSSGSLFDMMQQHLKKKQKSFPPPEAPSEGQSTSDCSFVQRLGLQEGSRWEGAQGVGAMTNGHSHTVVSPPIVISCHGAQSVSPRPTASGTVWPRLCKGTRTFRSNGRSRPRTPQRRLAKLPSVRMS